MHTHLFFDLIAWTVGLGAGLFAQNLRKKAEAPFSKIKLPLSYYAIAAIGAVWGAFFFGSLNIYLTGEELSVGRSVVGAIAGGILCVETYKLATGIAGSTGGGFVAALAVGITIGRLGCFASGIEDFTYGTPTNVPWGIDFGDGLYRHPVQLYESIIMGSFAVVFFWSLVRRHIWAVNSSFYWFVLIYAGQRFLWEFLKPYPTVLGPLNVFHLVTSALIIYGSVMLMNGGERHGYN